ncbi:MAG TPA: cupin domain-containing protein [Dehalococcoidia bacterium]|jgi:quercetin dioxygenase-like cupin family protein|nr:cupin domain-containing protein [Dehalococcoidia bacterium]
MHYTRLYTGSDGLSHFGDAEVPLSEAAYAPPAPPYFVSSQEPASAVVMTALPPGWFGDWHPSPVLQWWFQLSGELEVQTGDGETRRFVAGSIVRVEDTTGRGHTTRVIGAETVRAVYVHLPEER